MMFPPKDPSLEPPLLHPFGVYAKRKLHQVFSRANWAQRIKGSFVYLACFAQQTHIEYVATLENKRHPSAQFSKVFSANFAWLEEVDRGSACQPSPIKTPDLEHHSQNPMIQVYIVRSAGSVEMSGWWNSFWEIKWKHSVCIHDISCCKGNQMQEHSHHKPPLTTSGTSNASNALLVIRSLCRAAPHSHFVSLFLLHGLGKQFARCKVTSSSSGVGVSGLLCCCWCWSRPRHRHRLSAIFPDFDKLSFTTQLCFCKSLVCCSLWSVCLTKLRLPQKSVSRIWYHTHIDAVLNRRGFTKILPKKRRSDQVICRYWSIYGFLSLFLYRKGFSWRYVAKQFQFAFTCAKSTIDPHSAEKLKMSLVLFRSL